jgi:hypothetical protein
MPPADAWQTWGSVRRGRWSCLDLDVHSLPTLILLTSIAACWRDGRTTAGSSPAMPVAAVAVAEPAPQADPDMDGDRLVDVDDHCPTQTEDLDGFDDHDGCPDPDNDGDGVPDDADRCALDPENVNGFEDADGCFDRRPRDPWHVGVPAPVALPACCRAPLTISRPSGAVNGCDLEILRGTRDVMPPNNTSDVPAVADRRPLWVDHGWHRPSFPRGGDARWLLDVGPDDAYCGVLGTRPVIVVLRKVH